MATIILSDMCWPDTSQAPILEGGVAVEGGCIVAVGTNSDLRAQFPAAEMVEARDAVITPAFVNAHHHMYGVLAHGIPLSEAPAGFWPFLEDYWWPRVEDRLTHELIAASAEWACLEMVRSGVTTFYDCLEAPNAIPGGLDVIAEVVRRWGLRGVLSFEATERLSPENSELGLRENAGFVASCRERDDLVSGMMCFHTTFTCSAGFIQRAFDLAASTGARVHMHLSEGTYEPEVCLDRFGVRPVVYSEQLGVLSGQVLASQCVQIDAEEIALLAERGVSVSHQPISNCEVGGGLAPVPEMLAAGINVALGTDGYVNNFFEVMRAAALIPRARLLDPGAVSAHEAWTMATRNGARALGFDSLGTLRPGAPADLLLISADLPSPLEDHNLADQLLLWRNPSDVQGVMCAGRWLMRDGEVLGVDPEVIGKRVSEAAARLWRNV